MVFTEISSVFGESTKKINDGCAGFFLLVRFVDILPPGLQLLVEPRHPASVLRHQLRYVLIVLDVVMELGELL